MTISCMLLHGCGLDRRVNYRHDVEIAPNQWLTLSEQRGKCWFICEWRGKKVTWPGRRNQLGELELPICLREHNDNLYLIVLDREIWIQCGDRIEPAKDHGFAGHEI